MMTVNPDISNWIPIYFEGEFSYLKGAEHILMKDATMEFKIEGMDNQNNPLIKTRVIKGGIIRARKAINFPGMDRSRLNLTTKDKHDILWGLERSVDIICLSFVCSAAEVKRAKNFIQTQGGRTKKNMPKIWAKIETKEGVDNFGSILKEVDGIMLGRGDLAPEVGIFEVPEIQANLVKKMKSIPKDFVIATQVLESMVRNPTPNRAELNDIYYCLENNVSGFMLAAETGVGKYPILAVETLKKMIERYNSSALLRGEHKQKANESE